MKKVTLVAGIVAIVVGATQASAAALAADITPEMTDINFIYAGLVAFAVVIFAMRKGLRFIS